MAGNLYTRNIHREFIKKNPTDKQESQLAKWASLIVKFGALLCVMTRPCQPTTSPNAIHLPTIQD
jgi:SSS family solute:Na+ symporter